MHKGKKSSAGARKLKWEGMRTLGHFPGDIQKCLHFGRKVKKNRSILKILLLLFKEYSIDANHS